MKLDEAVRHFKSQRKVAEILGINESAVSRWKKDNTVPLRRAVELSRLTSGELAVRFEDYHQ